MRASLVDDFCVQGISAGNDGDHRPDGQRVGCLSERDMREVVKFERAANVGALGEVVAKERAVEGNGHMDRCVTLGDELAKVVGECLFVGAVGMAGPDVIGAVSSGAPRTAATW